MTAHVPDRFKASNAYRFPKEDARHLQHSYRCTALID